MAKESKIEVAQKWCFSGFFYEQGPGPFHVLEIFEQKNGPYTCSDVKFLEIMKCKYKALYLEINIWKTSIISSLYFKFYFRCDPLKYSLKFSIGN